MEIMIIVTQQEHTKISVVSCVRTSLTVADMKVMMTTRMIDLLTVVENR